MKKYLFLEKTAKKAIDESKKQGATILMMVDGFITDKEALHLRDMLWYARNKGVEIIFVPNEKKHAKS